MAYNELEFEVLISKFKYSQKPDELHVLDLMTKKEKTDLNMDYDIPLYERLDSLIDHISEEIDLEDDTVVYLYEDDLTVYRLNGLDNNVITSVTDWNETDVNMMHAMYGKHLVETKHESFFKTGMTRVFTESFYNYFSLLWLSPLKGCPKAVSIELGEPIEDSNKCQVKVHYNNGEKPIVLELDRLQLYKYIKRDSKR